MAHFKKTHLPEKSEKLMESLGFTLIASCSRDSVWSHLECMEYDVYIDPKNPPTNVIDLLTIVRKNCYDECRHIVENDIKAKLMTEVAEFIDTKILKK